MSSFVLGDPETNSVSAQESVTTAPGSPAGGPATQPGGQPPGILKFLTGPMMIPILLLLVLYVFMFRSKKNQEKQKQSMLEGMKRGDRVQTIGGILGNVVDVRPEKILVKVDESSNPKIWFARRAIDRVLQPEGEKGEKAAGEVKLEKTT